MSFRTRLTLLTAAAVAIGIVAASAVVYFTARQQLRRDADRDLRARAAVLTAVLPPSRPGHPLALADWLRIASKVESADPDGPRVFFQANTPRFTVDARRQLASIPPLPARLVAQRGVVWRTIRRRGTDYRVLALPLAHGVVQIARPLADVERSLSRLRLLLLWVSLAGIALAVVLGAAVTRAGLAPLRRLAAAADHVIATGDLQQRIDGQGHGRDELAQLGRRFDEMLETLEQSVHAQRQLVADASHELRTPLTSIRANLRLLFGSPPADPAERDAMVSDVEQELESLTTIVGELLDLARGEEPGLEPERFRLDELARAVAERARRRAPDLTFELELEPSVVDAVPERVERAAVNLVDNACKWTPPGGTIRIRVRDGALEVEDGGPGIDPAERARIFERFHRSASANGKPGAGLGLAIVKQVADASGGSVTVGDSPDGGAMFRLQLSERDQGPFNRRSQAPANLGGTTRTEEDTCTGRRPPRSP
jgi:two-component system sensor histidine kinase MprB